MKKDRAVDRRASTAPGRLRRPFQSHVDSCFKDGSNTKHCAMTLDMREAPLPVVVSFVIFALPKLVSEVICHNADILHICIF